MSEVFPRNMVIINTEILRQRFLKLTGRFKRCLTDDVSDSSVEAFDHAVSLRPARLYQAVLNPVLPAFPIEYVFSGRLAFSRRTESVGELLPVVGEELRDHERSFLNEILQKRAGAFRCLRGPDLHIHPSGRPVDADKKVFPLRYMCGHKNSRTTQGDRQSEEGAFRAAQ
jgi:hypothetical protein